MDAIVQTSAIELAYSALLLEARSRPFEWGVHDCGTFAFAAVKARTGRDLLEPPTWRTAAEYARAAGFRLLVFPRSGSAALELLRQRLVHVAGLHRATAEHPERNVETVRTRLGAGSHLLRVAQWEEGVALPVDEHTRSPERLARSSRRWATREPESAARECLDEMLGGGVPEGQIIALLGSCGTGKTTLVKMIGGELLVLGKRIVIVASGVTRQTDREVAPGTYFCRLRAGDLVSSVKLILIR
jgi:hypothetical protein